LKTVLNFDNKLLVLFLFLLLFSVTLTVSTVAAAQNNPKVLFDETGPYGKDFTIYSIGPLGASSYANLLQENGFTVSKITESPITDDNLKDINVLIVMAPERNYTDDEIKTINNFVANGGGLFLLGDNWGNEDGGTDYAFNKLAKSFGVEYANNSLLLDSNNYFILTENPKITNITSSPLTANVPEFYYILGTYIKNTGTSNISAYSGADSWADIGNISSEGYTTSNEVKDTGELSGPFPVLSSMNYGNGKIVFMGSVRSYTNNYIYRNNGWKLGINAVSWLSNKPVPTSYQKAGLIPYGVGDLGIKILLTIIFGLIILGALLFKIKRNINVDDVQVIKTIKKWKFYGLNILNIFFIIFAGLIFIPINIYLLNSSDSTTYDPYLGYTLIITGILFLFFAIVTFYNILARQRILKNFNYINIAIILFFTILTILIGDMFSFQVMELFTVGGLILLIPSVVNLLIYRKYGPDLIVEGKEFDRLKRLSVKSLPYELHPFYKDSVYIGEGGFGRVFKATRIDNGRLVAIKIPKSFDKRSEKTFISEVSNWSQLDHPNIVKLYSYKILPIPYIETEFCEGHVEKGIKTLQEAVSIVYDVAKGLKYAHEKNIIHGDVKISNILIKNGVNKISDWGLSKLKIGDSITLSGATPSYAAPEQISREFGKADERTDIYQLGNVFYELITGRLPFVGDISEIYSSILKTQPIHPFEINDNARPVDEIIMKCLNKNKDERYSSMDELIAELEKYRPSDETTLFEEDEDS
jgi:eukaryotic-like serine/threonine-protein kinase